MSPEWVLQYQQKVGKIDLDSPGPIQFIYWSHGVEYKQQELDQQQGRAPFGYSKQQKVKEEQEKTWKSLYKYKGCKKLDTKAEKSL